MSALISIKKKKKKNVLTLAWFLGLLYMLPIKKVYVGFMHYVQRLLKKLFIPYGLRAGFVLNIFLHRYAAFKQI